MKNKRIDLTICNLGDVSKSMTAEDSWYWRRPERDIAVVEFRVQGNGHGIQLMEFFIPREFTQLISSTHWTGMSLKIADQVKDWHLVDAIDTTPYITRWPHDVKDLISMYNGKITVPEIEAHQRTLLHGWIKLICVWSNPAIPEIIHQLPWWENYLREELYDFRLLWKQAQEEGIEKTIQNPRGGREFLSYLKIASCCIALLSNVCPAILAILRLEKGQKYPCLYTGYLWMKHHHLGFWEKVKQQW